MVDLETLRREYRRLALERRELQTQLEDSRLWEALALRALAVYERIVRLHYPSFTAFEAMLTDEEKALFQRIYPGE